MEKRIDIKMFYESEKYFVVKRSRLMLGVMKMSAIGDFYSIFVDKWWRINVNNGIICKTITREKRIEPWKIRLM